MAPLTGKKTTRICLHPCTVQRHSKNPESSIYTCEARVIPFKAALEGSSSAPRTAILASNTSKR